MSSLTAVANTKKINPNDIAERYSKLSRYEIEALGNALLRDPRIITLLKSKGIEDTSPIQLIFSNKMANSSPIRNIMLKTDISNLITKMQLKDKEPDTLFIVLDEIIGSLAELGGGARRRRNRRHKTKKTRKTRRSRRNNKK